MRFYHWPRVISVQGPSPWRGMVRGSSNRPVGGIVATMASRPRNDFPQLRLERWTQQRNRYGAAAE